MREFGPAEREEKRWATRDGRRARGQRATPAEEMQRAKAALKQDFLDGRLDERAATVGLLTIDSRARGLPIPLLPLEIDHALCRGLLSEYLEEDLEPRAQALIERHLNTCPSCGAFLRTLRHTLGLLRGLDRPALPEAVRQRLRRHAARMARAGATA